MSVNTHNIMVLLNIIFMGGRTMPITNDQFKNGLDDTSAKILQARIEPLKGTGTIDSQISVEGNMILGKLYVPGMTNSMSADTWPFEKTVLLHE